MKVQFKTYLKGFGLIVLTGILAFLFFIGLEGYHKFKSWTDSRILKEELRNELTRQQIQIAINQARAETTIVNSNDSKWKAEIDYLKKNNEVMMDLIKKNGEEIKNIGTITTGFNENVSLILKANSDHSYKENSGDPNEQYFKKIIATEKDKDGKESSLDLAWSIYYPNKKEWKTGLFPIEYKAKVIQAQQKDGQFNSYIEAWAQDDKGNKLPMKVTAEFLQTKKTSKEFYLWSPHISLNLDSSLDKTGGGLSFNTSGYGRTKNDLIWKFGEVGISTNGDDYWIKLSPVSYNIGEQIPFISNTFISPFMAYDFEDKFFGINLSIPF
jgi:hypothetical protein